MMKKEKQIVKGFLCIHVTEMAENKIGDVGKLEAEAIKNGLVLLKSQMTAIEVLETIGGLEKIIEELYLSLAVSAGVCENCSCREETEDAVSIKLPEFILEDAGIPKDAKLCAYTSEDSGEVTVVEAEYNHDLSDVPKDILQILKEMGVCMAGLNKRLMSDEIIYGKQVCCDDLNKSDE